jgi:hypothetical protein
MSITIPDNIPTAQQLQIAQTYINENKVSWSYAGKTYSFLPHPFIKELATFENIEAFVTQDPFEPSEYNHPEHSREWLADQFFKHSRKCFVAALYAGQDMYFLMRLHNSFYDDNLPMDNELNTWRTTVDALKAFYSAQALVIAPIFTIGSFDNVCPFSPAMPLISLSQAHKVGEALVLKAEFHRAHLRESNSTSQESEYTGRVVFFMREFSTRALADAFDAEGKMDFGYKMMGEYWVCYH